MEDLDDFWGDAFDLLKLERDVASNEIARIRRYAESVEQLLTERTTEIEQHKPKMLAGMSEQEAETLWEDYAIDLYEFESELPKIQRSSLFLYIFSFFEHIFLSIADSYGFMHNLRPLSSSYLKDKGITRACKYLKNIGLIDWPERWPVWEGILDLQRIRNLITHNQGRFHKKEDKNPREDFIKQWNAELSAESYAIELLRGFIFRVLDTFHRFFDELYATFPSIPDTEDMIYRIE
jgi:hypothetical protein